MNAATRPVPVSGALSVLTAAVAVALVADGFTQQLVVVLMLVALAGVAVGMEAVRSGRELAGGVVVVAAAVGAAAVVLFAATRPGPIVPVVELLPGLFGLAVLTLGVTAAFPGRERLFVTAGTAIVLANAFLSGLVYGAETLALLGATAATVVAWDLGEQAVNLGEQVGRPARTWPAEVTHGAGSAGIGVAAAGLGAGVYGVGVTDLPLAALAVLLGAAVVLAAALYN